MRVGVPRCLSYYYLSSLYRTFLADLGQEVMESQPTTAKDLTRLSLCPTDEPCISVKTAFAHAENLLKQGADLLFVPTVVSLSASAYCCPKMMGLPAMLRAGLDLEPWRVVSPIIDMKDNPGKWEDSWVRAAWSLGVTDRSKVRRAVSHGLSEWRGAEREEVLRAAAEMAAPRSGAGTTAVMGHAYVLDDIVANKVVDVAKEYGRIVLAEMVSAEDAQEQLKTLFDGEKMWTIEGHILGSALHLIRKRKVDRMVFVYAFSCGPASIIENYIAKEAEVNGTPLLCIAVDEHTGEAGLVTRMEAFLDSATRPRRAVAASTAVQTRQPRTMPVPDPYPSGGPIGMVSMGNLTIPVSTLLTEIGAEVVPAPPLTDDIVSLGKEIAPEFICYPMVTLIGQMRAQAQRGVNRIIMVQGKGRCRLGWYAQVMEEILRRGGYPVSVLSIDSPFPLRQKAGAMAESIRRLVGKVEPLRIARALEMAFTKLAVLDRAAEAVREARANEDVRGSADKRFDSFAREMARTGTMTGIAKAYWHYATDMRDIPRVDCDPLHVSVIGEIYVVNEPFVNKQAERILGSLERRVRVHRKLDVSGWVSHHLFKTPRAVHDYNNLTRMAEPYLPVAVGGHGQESVGEAVMAKKHGYDGVLHLFPFTCMPEIIAQNVLVKVSRDLDLPVLSLMISEQTGVAGLATRLEAFCDLLEGRRKRRDFHEVEG